MKDDYSDVCFSPGLVCRNSNNYSYCVVIDGRKGSEYDRASLVLEFCGENGFMLHTPPNRVLRPTGRVCNLRHLAAMLRIYVEED